MARPLTTTGSCTYGTDNASIGQTNTLARSRPAPLDLVRSLLLSKGTKHSSREPRRLTADELPFHSDARCSFQTVSGLRWGAHSTANIDATRYDINAESGVLLITYLIPLKNQHHRRRHQQQSEHRPRPPPSLYPARHGHPVGCTSHCFSKSRPTGTSRVRQQYSSMCEVRQCPFRERGFMGGRRRRRTHNSKPSEKRTQHDSSRTGRIDTDDR